MPAEFDIIRHYFQRQVSDEQLLLGIGDDGAVIRPRSGHDQVVVTDTIIEGRHFPRDFPAADIGWRSLAVNLSDIAAMGATPRFAFLNLSLPFAAEEWLQEFAVGFFECAKSSNTILAGGDTTQGPMTITVTVIGEVPEGGAIPRSGACPGDLICVSGTPGDAAAGLELLQRGNGSENRLVQRFRRPQPRLALGIALRDIATAMIDISDGLLADLGHVLAASGTGAIISVEKLPCSDELKAYAERPADYVLAGGDDYELCFTVPGEQRDRLLSAHAGVTVIGEITADHGLRVVGPDGEDWQASRRGWTHFSTESNNEA